MIWRLITVSKTCQEVWWSRREYLIGRSSRRGWRIWRRGLMIFNILWATRIKLNFKTFSRRRSTFRISFTIYLINHHSKLRSDRTRRNSRLSIIFLRKQDSCKDQLRNSQGTCLWLLQSVPIFTQREGTMQTLLTSQGLWSPIIDSHRHYHTRTWKQESFWVNQWN